MMDFTDTLFFSVFDFFYFLFCTTTEILFFGLRSICFSGLSHSSPLEAKFISSQGSFCTRVAPGGFISRKNFAVLFYTSFPVISASLARIAPPGIRIWHSGVASCLSAWLAAI